MSILLQITERFLIPGDGSSPAAINNALVEEAGRLARRHQVVLIGGETRTWTLMPGDDLPPWPQMPEATNRG